MTIDLILHIEKLERQVQPPGKLVEVVTVNWGADNEITRKREQLTSAECLERFGWEPDPLEELKVTVDGSLDEGW